MSTTNISASLYTTTYVDRQPMRVRAQSGTVGILLGDGNAGTQHLILPVESARLLADEILAAITKADAA